MVSRILAVLVLIAAIAGAIWYVFKPRPWRQISTWDTQVRAYLTENIGDLATAKALNERILSILPGSLRHLGYEVLLLLREGGQENLEKALQTCDRILQAGEEGAARGGLIKADLLLRMGRPDEARSTLQSVADAVPFEAAAELGDISLGQLSPIEALGHYQRALEVAIEPTDEARAHAGIAAAYLLLADFAETRSPRPTEEIARLREQARSSLTAGLRKLLERDPQRSEAERRVLWIARLLEQRAALETTLAGTGGLTPLQRAWQELDEAVARYRHLLPEEMPPSIELFLANLRLRSASEEKEKLPLGVPALYSKEAADRFAAALKYNPDEARELLARIPREGEASAAGDVEKRIVEPRVPEGIEYAQRLVLVCRMYLGSAEFERVLEDRENDSLALARRVRDGATCAQTEVARAFLAMQGLAHLRAGRKDEADKLLSASIAQLPEAARPRAWVENARQAVRVLPGDRLVFEYLDRSRGPAETELARLPERLAILVAARKQPAITEEAQRRIDAAVESAMRAASSDRDRIALAGVLRSLRGLDSAIDFLERAAEYPARTPALRQALAQLFVEKAASALAGPEAKETAIRAYQSALLEDAALLLQRPAASRAAALRVGATIRWLRENGVEPDIAPAVRAAFPSAPAEAAGPVARAVLGLFAGTQSGRAEELKSASAALDLVTDPGPFEPFYSFLRGTLLLGLGDTKGAREAFGKNPGHAPSRIECLRLELGDLKPTEDVPEDRIREIESLASSPDLEHQGYAVLAVAYRQRYRARYVNDSYKNSEVLQAIASEQRALREAIRRNPGVPQLYQMLAETFLLGPPWDLERFLDPGKKIVDRKLVDWNVSLPERTRRAANVLLAAQAADERILEQLANHLELLAALASDPAERERLRDKARTFIERRAFHWPSAESFSRLLAFFLANDPEAAKRFLAEGKASEETPPGATDREKFLLELLRKFQSLPEHEGLRLTFLGMAVANQPPPPTEAERAQWNARIAEIYSRALADYESRGPAVPIVVLNNLAWYLSESQKEEDRQRAIAVARRARDEIERRAREAYVAPSERLDVDDTYAWALYRSGDLIQAREILTGLLANADRLRPDQVASVRYHLARLLFDVPDYAAALEQVQAALDLGARFAEEARARELRDRILDARARRLEERK